MIGNKTVPRAGVPSDSAVPLAIHLFGPFEVRLHGQPLPRLRSRKGQCLLALLTLRHGGEVDRSWLAGTLWPDSPETAAFVSLRACLKDLRRALGAEAARLQSPTPRLLALDLAGAQADVVAFDASIARGDVSSLEQAIALYRGPLLAEWTEDWVFQERQAREQAYLSALESLAHAAQARGEGETAERHLRRAAAVDPLRETAHRALMQALAASGNYAAASEVYRELRLGLHRELNAEPDAETTALYQQLRAAARDRAMGSGQWVVGSKVEGAETSLTLQPPVPYHDPLPGYPPARTLTFLFTDIEGSTRLWEEHPAAMPEALARHNDLLRRAIEAEDGHLFKTLGDQCCAAFSSAASTLAAALAAQRALAAEAWGPAGIVRVRMALHTGAVEARDGDYLGAPLNRVARLLATAHGEQILCSLAVAELVREQLPEGTSLRDLGVRRLRDLIRPEQIFQLVAPGLPADFPPLRSLEAFPHNLPLQLTRFIGREDQMAEIQQLLTEHRLLTLTGAGGCGKTRLALQVAAELGEAYLEGIWLVELAPLAEPALVPQTVAAALGVREEPGRPLTATLAEYLRAKSLLLLLDNCEHLLLAGAQLADTLLRTCPRLRILATSREGLGLAGERTYRVPSLSLPPAAPTFQSAASPSGSAALREDDVTPPVERLVQYEAVSLFIERAGVSQSGFAVTPENAAAVAQVCQRLEGIPLAIELAAARLQALPVETLAARLNDTFGLLTGGSRTALPRQQTLRALIDWSYDLLTEPEQALLRRLSIFAAGWTLEAAEAVTCGEAGGGCASEAIEAREVVDGLTALVAKSLVQYEAGAGGAAARYRLLETVRQYSRDRLGEAGEAAAVRGRHRDWFLALAERAEPHLCRGADQAIWRDCLETEHDNLRAVLEACVTAVASGQWPVVSPSGSKAPVSAASSSELTTDHWPLTTAAEVGLRLATALTSFWVGRGHLAEARQWFDRVLAGAAGASAAARGRALVGGMRVAFFQGDATAEASLAAEGLALGGEAGDKWLTARSLYHAGHLALGQCQNEQAQALAEEGLAVARELGDKGVIASLLQMLGLVTAHRGDDERGRVLHSESLALFRELEDTGGIAYQLASLGELAERHGDYEQAAALYNEALDRSRELNDRIQIVHQLDCLGGLALAQEDLSTAQACYSEAAGLARALNFLGHLAWCLSQLGGVACRRGDYETATARHQESLAVWQGREEQGGIAMAHYRLGTVAQQQGDYLSARAHHAQTLALWREAGYQHGVAECLDQLAVMTAAQGQPLKAARLFGAAEALRKASGVVLPPIERINHDQESAALRAALGEAAFAAAWAAGRALPLDEAVAVALTAEA